MILIPSWVMLGLSFIVFWACLWASRQAFKSNNLARRFSMIVLAAGALSHFAFYLGIVFGELSSNYFLTIPLSRIVVSINLLAVLGVALIAFLASKNGT